MHADSGEPVAGQAAADDDGFFEIFSETEFFGDEVPAFSGVGEAQKMFGIVLWFESVAFVHFHDLASQDDPGSGSFRGWGGDGSGSWGIG